MTGSAFEMFVGDRRWAAENERTAGSVRLRYFLADHLETRKRIRAEGGTDRYVNCVASTGNQDTANSRNVVTRIEGVPLASQECLEPAREIHCPERRGQANVAQVPCAVTCRNVQASAKRNPQMGKVSTNTDAFIKRLLGRPVCLFETMGI